MNLFLINKFTVFILLIFIFLFFNCNKIYKEKEEQVNPLFFKGINLEGPPKRFSSLAFEQLKKTHTNAVGVIPYAFLDNATGRINISPDYQWWGESVEGVKETIQYAHENNLKVMLKPHVWVKKQGWPGDLMLKGESLLNWKRDYKKYILLYAKLAEKQQVKLFCIGTEFRHLSKEKEYWVTLIQEVRKKYSGKITYAANWDNYESVSFWSSLDYIGIDAYFPLKKVNEKISKALLKYNALLLRKKLYQYAKAYDNKPILFTEYGFKDLKNSSSGHWNAIADEKDENEQALCFDVLMEVFKPDNLFAGGFIWKWHLTEKNNRDYFSPQGKMSEKIITKHFQKY